LNPQNPAAYRNRGLVYYDQKDYDKAIADYSTAIRLDPKFADAYYDRGVVYIAQQDRTSATNDFQKVLALQPDYPSKPFIQNYLNPPFPYFWPIAIVVIVLFTLLFLAIRNMPSTS